MILTKSVRLILLCSMALLVFGCASPTSMTAEASESKLSRLPTLLDPLAAGWQGSSVCERLHEDERQRVRRCTFPPGVGHEPHFRTPHFGYVVAGSVMQVSDESGTRRVESRSGSSWTSDGTAWHEVLDIGDTTGVYLIVEPIMNSR